MESGFHRCGILILRKENICNCEEITLLNGQVIRKIENDEYKYLGIAVLSRVKEQDDKFPNTSFQTQVSNKFPTTACFF